MIKIANHFFFHLKKKLRNNHKNWLVIFLIYYEFLWILFYKNALYESVAACPLMKTKHEYVFCVITSCNLESLVWANTSSGTASKIIRHIHWRKKKHGNVQFAYFIDTPLRKVKRMVLILNIQPRAVERRWR